MAVRAAASAALCLSSRHVPLAAASAALHVASRQPVPAIAATRLRSSGSGTDAWTRRASERTVARRSVVTFAQASDASVAAGGAAPEAAGAAATGEEDEVSFWTRIQEHQREAPKLTSAEEARTVLQRCTRGVLSTTSQKYEGFPFGSMVTFACDDSGRPILAVSSLSPHTGDLLADARCSLLVSRNPLVTSDSVVVVVGRAEKMEGADREAARAAYLKRHPEAFWVDFGDFHLLRIDPVKVRVTGNVATFAAGASVAELTADEYLTSAPDPIAPFEDPIARHMNSDHEDAIVAMVQAALQVQVSSARILYVDRFGFLVETTLRDKQSRVRLPFPRPAADRKDVKDLIVQMTREAAGAKALQ